MNQSPQNPDDTGEPGQPRATLERLLADWGQPVDKELLVVAMTHRSFAHEHGKTGSTGTNERLEFLGDAVLQIVVTEYLFRNFPDVPEGELAPMRAATVSQTPLAEVARRLHLGDYILLGIGEDRQGGREKDSILSDTLEALIGASYLTSGLESTRVTIERHLRRYLRNAPRRAVGMDWKTHLSEFAAANSLGEPEYVVQGSGPDHARVFRAEIRLGGEVMGKGQGTSKKSAEHSAAEAAFEALQDRFGDQVADA